MSVTEDPSRRRKSNAVEVMRRRCRRSMRRSKKELTIGGLELRNAAQGLLVPFLVWINFGVWMCGAGTGLRDFWKVIAGYAG